jgi:hypothetical protein
MSDPDPNTEVELRRAREESKSRRLRIQELEELNEAMKSDATAKEKQILKLQGDLTARTTELETVKAETGVKIKQLETDVTAKVTEATTAKDAEIATIRTGYDTQILASEVKTAALTAGARDAEAFVKLVDLSKVTRDKDGKLVGVDELIAAEKTGRAWMFGDPTSTVKPGQTAPTPAGPSGPKSALQMTPEEYQAGMKAHGIRLQ